jgi:hypothetical protein
VNYYEALKHTGKLLEARLSQSKNVLHSASKGAIRELIINDIIRPFLPQCYGLSGGESFDRNGKVSKQLDLVIYDTIFSYIVPYSSNFIQFPCESVYGNIEIKSYINKAEFLTAIENIESLKSLDRENSTSLTVTPHSRISVNNKPDDRCNYFFGIIFAYDSVEVNTILEYIKELTSDPKVLPNAIILYSKKTIILPIDNNHIYTRPNLDDYLGYEALFCGEETLSLFIGLLISYLRLTKLFAADINKETDDIFIKLLNEHYEKTIAESRPKSCAILKSKLP